VRSDLQHCTPEELHRGRRREGQDGRGGVEGAGVVSTLLRRRCWGRLLRNERAETGSRVGQLIYMQRSLAICRLNTLNASNGFFYKKKAAASG